MEQTKPATQHLHARRHVFRLLSALISPGPSKVERPQDVERKDQGGKAVVGRKKNLHVEILPRLV